ncbi:DUF1206 domain-containing protein [Streptomyces sp. ms191]|uniref:DUF1206 domain-containing protein n=1 Tax=unclassified Streptomyces TaxID=2593676 RepID=UPI0011CE6079|nr:DUF1206 domain-containing protein [Streptomyces sp. ms191]
MADAHSPRSSMRSVARSDAVRVGARSGFAARGVLYLLIGVLAVRIGMTGGGEQADRGGALEQIAATPAGAVPLWALGAGLAGMAVWRLTEAVFGAAGPDGHKPGKRALSAVRSVFYAFVAAVVLAFAAGAGNSGAGETDRQSQDATARLLALPAGRWLVGAAAVGIVVAGLWIAAQAVRRKYRKHLDRAMSKKARRYMDVTGVAGGVARGALLAAVGYFALRAAIDFDPDEAKGMDDAIRSFAQTGAGPWLLIALAAGLALFGLFSFGMSRWRRV